MSSTAKLLLTAVLSSSAAIFQSAGGFMPGIGFVVSPLTTLPIFLATFVSVKYGILSYFVTILLLLLIQPSELFIFPFTTGILGLALGVAFPKSRVFVVLTAGASLFIGIVALLYLFRFPVLGPAVGTSFQLLSLLLIALFCILYAWLAATACSFILKRIIRKR
ncbi:hypothetical protein IEO70_02620 [Bacillus sp. AGMB 02131]|uniref:Uncharacterized protein n=1 Tax=Peribacillus faecalis TaxID=2772559 RepID=A0A927CWH3_9BACI|nr:hypothetical protein [Peribacillus faecalis]